MYFDAVVDISTSPYTPIYNGTPAEVAGWLKVNPDAQVFNVCVGRTLAVTTASEYLESALTQGYVN